MKAYQLSRSHIIIIKEPSKPGKWGRIYVFYDIDGPNYIRNMVIDQLRIGPRQEGKSEGYWHEKVLYDIDKTEWRLSDQAAIEKEMKEIRMGKHPEVDMKKFLTHENHIFREFIKKLINGKTPTTL